MSEQISILKLKDGSTIVGKVKTSGDIVEIEGTQWLCESFGWKELEAPCNEIDAELIFGLY